MNSNVRRFRRTAAWAARVVAQHEERVEAWNAGRTDTRPSVTKTIEYAYRMVSRAPLHAERRCRTVGAGPDAAPAPHSAAPQPGVPPDPTVESIDRARQEQEIGRLFAELMDKWTRLHKAA